MITVLFALDAAQHFEIFAITFLDFASDEKIPLSSLRILTVKYRH